MDLYIAFKGSKRGTIYDLTDEGLEELTFHEKEAGKRTPAGYKGLIIPFNSMADDLIKMPRRGGKVDPKVFEHVRH